MIKDLKVGDLDDFVTEVDKLGGPRSDRAMAAFPVINLAYNTKIDVNLDPFSDAYFLQQIRLHTEISGKVFNQSINELGEDIDKNLIYAHNPSNNPNIGGMAGHLRAVANAIVIANLPNSANILDLGVGSGYTSEFMAFCGGKVDAIDINPKQIDLINTRAERLSLPITAKVGNFDKIEADRKYDLIFFYESLHHAARPWLLIDDISKLLRPNGKIAFAGEPINSWWWPNWGLRLDLEALYMMRKYGWLESGWSEQFIRNCFEKANLKLSLYPDIGLNRGAIGIATSKNIDPRYNQTPEIIGASIDGEAQALRNELNLKDAALVECYRDLNRINSTLWWKVGSKIDQFARTVRKGLNSFSLSHE